MLTVKLPTRVVDFYESVVLLNISSGFLPRLIFVVTLIRTDFKKTLPLWSSQSRKQGGHTSYKMGCSCACVLHFFLPDLHVVMLQGCFNLRNTVITPSALAVALDLSFIGQIHRYVDFYLSRD